MNTLKHISLLPPEIRARQRARRRVADLMANGGVILLALLAVYACLVILTLHTRADIRELQSERAAVENKMSRYQQWAEMESRARRLASLIQQAMADPPDWAEVMMDVSACMPADVWLSDVSATRVASEQSNQSGRTGTNPEITLRGWCLDHLSVSHWLGQLGRIRDLTDVRCQFASEQETGQSDINFEIKARVRPGEPFLSSVERGD